MHKLYADCSPSAASGTAEECPTVVAWTYHRALAEEDSQKGGAGAVAAAAGSDGSALYHAGDYSSSGSANLAVYLTKKVLAAGCYGHSAGFCWPYICC